MNQHHHDEIGEIGKKFNAPLYKEGLFDTPVVKFSWNDSYCMHGHLWMSLCAHDVARAFRKQRAIFQHNKIMSILDYLTYPSEGHSAKRHAATCDVEDLKFNSVFRTLCWKLGVSRDRANRPRYPPGFQLCKYWSHPSFYNGFRFSTQK